MERVRGELPAASGVPQRMSVVLTCGGDILCCLGEEQPGLDLQNALWSLRELQMDTGTVGWHCHPKPQAVECHTVNAAFNRNVSDLGGVLSRAAVWGQQGFHAISWR